VKDNVIKLINWGNWGEYKTWEVDTRNHASTIEPPTMNTTFTANIQNLTYMAVNI